MSQNIFIESKLIKFTVLEINCKKLLEPDDRENLRVFVDIGIDFNKTKKDEGHNIIFNMKIKCEENEEEKLFSLRYSLEAFYKFKYDGDDIEEKFKADFQYFIRELYTLSYTDLNEIFSKAKVNFQIPPFLPDEIKTNAIINKDE